MSPLAQRAERRHELALTHGVRTAASNGEAVEGADIVILAIKPQMLGRVARDIGPHLRHGQLVLSVLAGATTRALTTALGHGEVVRSMPNTPAGGGGAPAGRPPRGPPPPPPPRPPGPRGARPPGPPPPPGPGRGCSA